MEKNPLVSVIIPVFSASHLKETLESLQVQTYRNLEILVVDDGSADPVIPDLKKEYSSDGRIRFERKDNGGAAAARNYGFRLSKGELIKFMDADDLLNREAIANQVLLSEETPEALISSKWGRFYNNDLSTFILNPESVWRTMKGIDWLVESLKDGPNMMQCGMFLVPKRKLTEFGLWDERLNLIDDFEFFSRLICQSEQVTFCEDATLFYRSGDPSSLSGRKGRKALESAWLSVDLGCSHILKVRNDKEARRVCANMYAAWMYQFYPEHPDLVRNCEIKIKELGGHDLELPGGRLTRILNQFLPWKWVADIKTLQSSSQKRLTK